MSRSLASEELVCCDEVAQNQTVPLPAHADLTRECDVWSTIYPCIHTSDDDVGILGLIG